MVPKVLLEKESQAGNGLHRKKKVFRAALRLYRKSKKKKQKPFNILLDLARLVISVYFEGRVQTVPKYTIVIII